MPTEQGITMSGIRMLRRRKIVDGLDGDVMVLLSACCVETLQSNK